MRSIAVFICVLLVALQSHAQYTSQKGYFQVDNIRGCAPLTVNVTDLSGQCPCGISYGAAPCVDFPNTCSSFSFTYTTPGTYTIKYNPQNIGTGLDQITITVDPSVQPAFDVYTCASDKVKINITDKTYDSYTIDFNNDGIIDSTIPSGNNQTASYSYGSAGNYNISVKGKKLNAANNCAATVHTINALATLPAPVFNTLDAISRDTLKIGFTPQTNIQYQVEFATNSSSNFQVYKTLYSTNMLTIPNLSADQNYYCFRLNTHDPCTNSNIASIPVCSQKFDLSITSGKDQLNWLTTGSISTIDVVRNGSGIASLAGSARSYSDVAVTCKTDYCYQLKATYSNGAISSSLKNCGTAFLTDTPTPVNNASSLVADNLVQILWKADPAYPTSNYSIFKLTDGSDYFLLANSPTPDYKDATYNTSFLTCYKINYVDNCGNQSLDGSPICPMQLTGSIDGKNHVTLSWNAYNGWKQGVKNYTVQKFNSRGTLVNTFITTSPGFTDDQDDFVNQTVTYSITANPNETGLSVSTSNQATFVKQIHLYSPTAFNPESRHAENSSFIVKGHYLANLQLQIFDRWGTLVYSSDRDEPWDGKKDGQPMPTATYVWTAQGTDFSGKEFKEAGTVLLIRNKN